ncbi:MAG TPA: fibronectin type III domain-containing protein [Methanomassiliicoccales archaeon]|nr:fibronectin type III domain-containing protein [Methanomassiliicoccales archaeon]
MGKGSRALVLALLMLAPIMFAGVFASSGAQGIVIVLPPTTGWRTGTVDAGGLTGYYVSSGVDGAGKLHVAYYDGIGEKLRYATDANGSWVTMTVDSGNVGQFCDIAIDANGKSHISYYDATNHALKYATDKSGAWVNVTVDRSGSVGQYSSITLDTSGNPCISYYDADHGGALKFAHMSAGAWVNRTVDDPLNNVGQFSSLAIGSDGRVNIIYWDSTDLDLKFATAVNASANTYTGGAVTGSATATGPNALALNSTGVPQVVFCTADHVLHFAKYGGVTWDTSALAGADPASLFTPSMVVGQNDVTYVTYMNYSAAGPNNLHIAVGGPSVWQHDVVSATPGAGGFSSVSVDFNGKVHVMYDQWNQGDPGTASLTYATNSGTSWYRSVADATNGVGGLNSIAVDNAGNIHVAYMGDSQDLLYAEHTSTGWTTAVADPFHYLNGWTTSIAVDSAGKAFISYYDGNAHTLKYATNVGGSWSNQTVTDAGAMESSILVDANGHVNIAFVDQSSHQLRYSNNTVGTWSTTSIDSTNFVTGGVSMVEDAKGKLHALYFTSSEARIATNENGTWQSAAIDSSLVGFSNYGASLAIDSGGHLHALYSIPTDRFLRYNTNATGSWVHKNLESNMVVGWCSIGIGPDDVVQVAYQDNTAGSTSVAMVVYQSIPEGVWMRQVVGFPNVGVFGQMALDKFGRPFASYLDQSDQDLNVIQLVNAPSAPTGVAALRGNGNVTVTWSTPDSNGGAPLFNYKIFHGPSEAALTLAATVTGSVHMFVDDGLTNGVREYYKVVATNLEGQGTPSTTASAVPATVPSVVLNLRVENGDGQVKLSWDAPASSGGVPVTLYKVYRGTNQSNLVLIGNATGTSYTDTGLENGKTYYYAVAAMNDVGVGVASSVASAAPATDYTVIALAAILIVAVVIVVYWFFRVRK